MEFEIKEVGKHSEEWHITKGNPWKEFDEWREDVGIYIDGELHDDYTIDYRGYERYVNERTFLEKMKSSIPSEPYDAIYMMAIVAATPEVEEVENKLRQDKENNEKLNRKILSEFMNNGRSEESLKGFDVSVDVSVEPRKYPSGEGKAVVTLENKANQKAVVEFKATPGSFDFNEPRWWYEKEFNIIVEGKEIFHNVEFTDVWSRSFLENMKSSTIPPKPYDAIYKMAVIAATPKVEKAENEPLKNYLARKEASKKEYKEWLKQREKEDELKRSLQEKAISDFMNRGRS